jgi:hypothetical protein
MLDKFHESVANEPRDKIFALGDILSDIRGTDCLKADYKSNIQDVIFDTVSFILNFNELYSPICCFFDWTMPEFSGNLNVLANEVLKCEWILGMKRL